MSAFFIIVSRFLFLKEKFDRIFTRSVQQKLPKIDTRRRPPELWLIKVKKLLRRL